MAGDISLQGLQQLRLLDHGIGPAGLTNSNTVSYPAPVRKWIALVTSDPEATADFIAQMEEMKQRVFAAFESPETDPALLRGQLSAIKDLRFVVTSAVNEERQRARRPVHAA